MAADNRQARKACRLLLDEGLQRDGGINYGPWAKWTDRGETCVTGMVLSILSHFRYEDDRLDTIADNLLELQMPDGGWNCRRPYGATHSSVHTTISALEGLRLYELHRGRRLADAIDIVQTTQLDDGRWSLQQSFKGKTYFELERLGAPSRWNTLRALRVLKWWNA